MNHFLSFPRFIWLLGTSGRGDPMAKRVRRLYVARRSAKSRYWRNALIARQKKRAYYRLRRDQINEKRRARSRRDKK